MPGPLSLSMHPFENFDPTASDPSTSNGSAYGMDIVGEGITVRWTENGGLYPAL